MAGEGKFETYGGFVGFAFAFLYIRLTWPVNVSMVTAGIIGTVGGGIGAGLGMAFKSFVDALRNADTTDVKHGSTRLAITSLILGLLGLGAWLIPIMGFAIGAAGVFIGRKGSRSSKRTVALIGMGPQPP